MNKHVAILVVVRGEEELKHISESLKIPEPIAETVAFGKVEPAIDFLKKEDEHANAKTPDLVLLDLDGNEKQGIELLSFIKNDKKLKVIPVIIIASSFSQGLLNDCYKNHVNCIITKPVNFKKFSQVIETIKDFWINIAELPKIKDET
jgi:CheY-like chemotaxis protein